MRNVIRETWGKRAVALGASVQFVLADSLQQYGLQLRPPCSVCLQAAASLPGVLPRPPVHGNSSPFADGGGILRQPCSRNASNTET